jgi:ribosomal protein S18 acetylase RimI-like enzyme
MQLTLKEMRIREIVPEDRDDVLRLLEATGVFQNYEIEVADEVIQASIDPASGYLSHIIVNEENRAVAYACWGPTPCTSGTFDLYWIAVHPDYQQHGLGRQLMNFVEADIQPKGARLLLIETSSYSDYEDARKFYSRSGYKQLAVIPDYYRQGDHKIVYGKNFV